MSERKQIGTYVKVGIPKSIQQLFGPDWPVFVNEVTVVYTAGATRVNIICIPKDEPPMELDLEVVK